MEPWSGGGTAASSTDATLATSASPPPATYAELLGLDAATRARWLPVAARSRRASLDSCDLELLAWLAAARCALSSQVHRRTSPGRGLTTTQRRLKRLADAGLLARFQLHGGDGGGAPFCCAVTDHALDLLDLAGRRAPVLGEEALDSLRADIHTVGWLLALEAWAGGALVSVLGPGRARLAPAGDLTGGPGALELGPGVHARDFLTGSLDDVPRRPVERFLPLTPAAVAELRMVRGTATVTNDLLLFHEPATPFQSLALLERCDHLIGGWWRLVPRYARLGSAPTAVILSRDRDRATALARTADRALVACLARIGEPPERWAYPGRRGVFFVAERDLHDGDLVGWRVPPLVAPLRPSDDGPRCEPIVALAGSRPVPAVVPSWR